MQALHAGIEEPLETHWVIVFRNSQTLRQRLETDQAVYSEVELHQAGTIEDGLLMSAADYCRSPPPGQSTIIYLGAGVERRRPAWLLDVDREPWWQGNLKQKTLPPSRSHEFWYFARSKSFYFFDRYVHDSVLPFADQREGNEVFSVFKATEPNRVK